MARSPRLTALSGSHLRTAQFLRTQRRPTMGLAANVLLDEIVLAVLQDPKLFPTPEDLRIAGDEVVAAAPLWRERGWDVDPESYHCAPPAPAVRQEPGRSRGLGYTALTFPTAYEPHPDEPGRDRWLSRPGNRTAHAAVLRTRTPGRPWLVCVHGFGMGQPYVDFGSFKAAALRREHDINLAFPVLPSHGARREPGKATGEGFTSANLLDGIHGITQAVWEVRSVIAWIREEDPQARIGVYGISLGACVASLVASLERDLACAIAGIPVSDLFELYRRTSPPAVARMAATAGAMGPEADILAAVVSPLRMTANLPVEDRYIVAGTGDRMTSPEQALRLWEHWDKPSIQWFPGGHIGFFLTRHCRDFLGQAVRRSLLGS